MLPADNIIERSVTIGGKDATNLTVVSHSQITAVTPPYTGSGNIENLPLIVTVEGVVGITFDFSYGRPLITAVSEASIFGGVVTVTGDNFGPLGSAHIEEVSVSCVRCQNAMSTYKPFDMSTGTDVSQGGGMSCSLFLGYCSPSIANQIKSSSQVSPQGSGY